MTFTTSSPQSSGMSKAAGIFNELTMHLSECTLCFKVSDQSIAHRLARLAS